MPLISLFWLLWYGVEQCIYLKHILRLKDNIILNYVYSKSGTTQNYVTKNWTTKIFPAVIKSITKRFGHLQTTFLPRSVILHWDWFYLFMIILLGNQSQGKVTLRGSSEEISHLTPCDQPLNFTFLSWLSNAILEAIHFFQVIYIHHNHPCIYSFSVCFIL